MGILDRFFARPMPVQPATDDAGPRAPRMAAGDGGVEITTPQELEEALRTGSVSGSGAVVSPNTAMRVAAVYACVRIISGAVATLPLHIKRRVDARTREDASDSAIWKVLRRKPNKWQKPAQFRRMMQAHVLLRGNAYAHIGWSRDRVVSLVPMHPDRVTVQQLADLSLQYTFIRKDGTRVELPQREVLHLVGLTLDGVMGVTPLTYAREAIGLSLSMEKHGADVFKNGAQVSGVLTTASRLNDESRKNLRESIDAYRSGGDKAGKVIVLEDGLEYKTMAMNHDDAQWLESRKFSRSDIAMFFGVPPHMIGDTEKSTSWGSGIEQQSQGFVAYTLEDHLTMWEEAINSDCIAEDSDLYARFNRNALVRGDIKARWEAYVKALQWGVYSPNRVLELEDENPREGGDIYYDPPNTAGGGASGSGEQSAPAREED
jgi:HK97 family phage portal protein